MNAKEFDKEVIKTIDLITEPLVMGKDDFLDRLAETIEEFGSPVVYVLSHIKNKPIFDSVDQAKFRVVYIEDDDLIAHNMVYVVSNDYSSGKYVGCYTPYYELMLKKELFKVEHPEYVKRFEVKDE